MIFQIGQADKLDEPKIYIPIKNSDVRKYYKLKIYPQKCYIKKAKLIITDINRNDIFTIEKIDLGQVFSRLEKVINKLNINELQAAPNKSIFGFISMGEFNVKGNDENNEIKLK